MPDGPVSAIFTGLACGALLTAVGLTLWSHLRRVPGASRAVRAIRWLAGAFLLIGALLAWQGDRSLSAPASRLAIMAALAAPASPGRRHRRYSPWGDVALILPALILAGIGLFWTSEQIGVEAGMDGLPTLPVELVAIICGGIGARALGEALGEIATSSSPPKLGGTGGGLEWASAATYALLTLLVGGMALANLWQRGSVGGGTAAESGLAGAWLAWGAAWLAPRHPPWLRTAMIAVAVLLLISTVLLW